MTRRLIDSYFVWANAAAAGNDVNRQEQRFSLTHRTPIQRYCTALHAPTVHLVDERSAQCAALRGTARWFVRYEWAHDEHEAAVWRLDYAVHNLSVFRCAMASLVDTP